MIEVPKVVHTAQSTFNRIVSLDGSQNATGYVILKEDEYKDNKGKRDQAPAQRQLSKSKLDSKGSSFNAFDERRKQDSPSPIRDVSAKI